MDVGYAALSIKSGQSAYDPKADVPQMEEPGLRIMVSFKRCANMSLG